MEGIQARLVLLAHAFKSAIPQLTTVSPSRKVALHRELEVGFDSLPTAVFASAEATEPDLDAWAAAFADSVDARAVIARAVSAADSLT